MCIRFQNGSILFNVFANLLLSMSNHHTTPWTIFFPKAACFLSIVRILLHGEQKQFIPGSVLIHYKIKKNKNVLMIMPRTVHHSLFKVANLNQVNFHLKSFAQKSKQVFFCGNLKYYSLNPVKKLAIFATNFVRFFRYAQKNFHY